jgi:hypothetical protein
MGPPGPVTGFPLPFLVDDRQLYCIAAHLRKPQFYWKEQFQSLQSGHAIGLAYGHKGQKYWFQREWNLKLQFTQPCCLQTLYYNLMVKSMGIVYVSYPTDILYIAFV